MTGLASIEVEVVAVVAAVVVVEGEEEEETKKSCPSTGRVACRTL